METSLRAGFGCDPLTCSVVGWHGGHQVRSDEAMCLGQREEVDCVSGGILQHHLQDLHR